MQEPRSPFNPVQNDNTFFQFPPPRSYDDIHSRLQYLAPSQPYGKFGNEIMEVSNRQYGPVGCAMMVGCSPGYMKPTTRYYPYTHETNAPFGYSGQTTCYHNCCRSVGHPHFDKYVEPLNENKNGRDTGQPIDIGYNSGKNIFIYF